MSALDAIKQEFPVGTWRGFAVASMALLGGAALWAATASLDRVAVAPGVVAPLGQVRTIQHLEGGTVSEIFVREGDAVVDGDPLIRVELDVGGLNADEIQVRLDALRLERARLLAETAQIDLNLPEAESARQPDLARAEAATYRSRRREYESGLAVLRDQKAQRELEVSSIVTRLEAARARMAPLEEQLGIVAHLAESNLAPKTRLLSLERDFKALEAEIAGLESSLPLTQTALAEARERELQERNRFRNAAASRLRDVEAEIARQVELASRAASRAERTTVASPIDGVVKNLAVNTIGGVVRAGAPLMEIVPTGETLVVEARLSPNDIGHVAVGQPARVKFATYDFLTYGVLEGAIKHIAADASQSESGEYFFRIIVETDADHLSYGEETYPISPGMTATVDIKLGRRTFMRYLVEPVLKFRDEAFRDP